MKIVCFGDSVTEGCFEILRINGEWELLYDRPSAYGQLLTNKLRAKYGDDKIEYVNSGLSGDGLIGAKSRMESEVIAHKPDLVIMAYELNDVGKRDPELFEKMYREVLDRFKEEGFKMILMSSNMMNSYVVKETPPHLMEMSVDCAYLQNNGYLDACTAVIEKLAKEYGYYFVNAYAEWKKLERYGVDTTKLLCNHLNHPKREMHNLFADMLFDCIEKNNLVE